MSKIPEGATHTAPDGTYRMARGSLWLGYADGDWVYIEGAAPHCYTKIRAESEWTGEGLPPVGLVVHTDHRGKEMTVKILAYGEHHKDKCVLAADMSRGIEGKMFGWIADQCDFRPIKTDEQVASENRYAAIKEMQRLVGSCNTFPFADLYDYGYRLQVAE